MTGERDHPIDDALRSRLAERCRAVGAPLWVFDPGDGAAPVAAPWPAFEPAARARAMLGLLGARAPTGDDGLVIDALFDGCWAAWLPVPKRARDGRRYAAILLGPAGLRHEAFGRVCAEGGADVGAVRAQAAGDAIHTRDTAAAIGRLLADAQADLAASLHDRDELDAVSAQLTEAYEEIGLLHTLGESMNALTAPDRFVQLTCDELAALTPFGWLVAMFAPDQPTTRCLDRTIFTTGRPPLRLVELGRLGRALLHTIDPARPAALGQDYGPLREAGLGASVLQPVTREGETVGVLLAGEKLGDEAEVTSVDAKRLEAAACSIAVLLENARLYEDQQAMFMGTLHALTSAIDAKDPYTRGHSERVAHLAHELSAAVGLPSEACERNRISGLVHDIGKIGVREAVLRKNGRLTKEEYDEVKQHPAIGYRILADIPSFDDLLPGVLHHHERFDGAGYPSGLAGAETPLQARVIGLCDAFDAMSSTRVYRLALPRPRVLQEIERGAGAQFDPELAQAFPQIDLARYDDMARRHRESDDAPGDPRELAA